MKIPVIDLAECTDCEGCLEMAPEVFTRSDSGAILVRELSSYPQEEVDDAIKNCPCGCIHWEDQ